MLSDIFGCVFTSGQIIEKATVNPPFPGPTPHVCGDGRKAASCCISAYKENTVWMKWAL